MKVSIISRIIWVGLINYNNYAQDFIMPMHSLHSLDARPLPPQRSVQPRHQTAPSAAYRAEPLRRERTGTERSEGVVLHRDYSLHAINITLELD